MGLSVPASLRQVIGSLANAFERCKALRALMNSQPTASPSQAPTGLKGSHPILARRVPAMTTRSALDPGPDCALLRLRSV